MLIVVCFCNLYRIDKKHPNKMERLEKKKALVEWLMALENDVILNKISELKDKESSDFQDNFENGLTLEEFRIEIKKRIETYR